MYVCGKVEQISVNKIIWLVVWNKFCIHENLSCSKKEKREMSKEFLKEKPTHFPRCVDVNLKCSSGATAFNVALITGWLFFVHLAVVEFDDENFKHYSLPCLL